MSSPWRIFVEGKDDQRFLECLLQHMGLSEVSTDTIGGGVGHLHKVKNQIVRSRDEGNRIAVMLDANCDFTSRSEKFLATKDKLQLPVECFFLLPNQADPGSLEILLEEMAVPKHRVLYECFDEYEACRQEYGIYHQPERKGRIYAYCEALGIETTASGRNYSDSCFWDLNAAALEPLKRFLLSLQAEEGAA